MPSRTLTPTLILSTRRVHDPPPRISVAISTYQRAHMLPRLFDALTRQTLPTEDFEVVLVDNGSTPETADAIRKHAPSSGLRLHVLRLESNEGPSPARDLAWREARADLIAFTDDDCAPAPDWLEEGLREMEEARVVVVGRTLPDPDLPIGPFSRTVYSLDPYWLPTCNVFYRRADLEAVDGFDQAYVKPGAEDSDLGYRVRAVCGSEFRFAQNALVYHDVRPSRFLDAAKETQRWSALPRFFRMHPSSRVYLHRGIFWKPSHPKALLASAGVLLGLRRPGFLMLVVPWLYYRTRIRKPLGHRSSRYAMLPGVLAVDLLEVVAMARGSVRHRSLVL